MVYTSIFVAESKVISKMANPKITNISDEDMESGENRVIFDLAEPLEPVGKSVSYQELLSCDYSFFYPRLEQAAMFAIISEINSNGNNNKMIGPITSAAGDGMSKSAGYYSKKEVSNDVLVGAEEKYLRIIRLILRGYRTKCMTKHVVGSRSNEFYNRGYNINNRDNRRVSGDTTI